ncbi:hypothetical protein BRD08_07545 [Halobacteriales archaeon SW_10_66_29]|nr:MAG: hypothetical protein BRD08_07545 [Halobacteriales archaeon SW_10_66_29]
MADTPNHEYNVPAQGDQDWHQPLNENFEEFEVDIELRDQESNLGDYDPSDGTISGTLATSKLDVGSISGSLTGGTELSNIAGSNLSIDSNGTLNASGGGGGGGGGEWTANNTLLEPSNSSIDGIDVGEVNTTELNGSLTGGTELTSIAGTNLSIDSNGQLNASGGGGGGGISSLSGGDGINPGSIGDGDRVSVAWGDAAGLGSSGEITGGNWVASGSLLEPSDGSIDGVDVDRVETTTLTVDGTPTLRLGPTGTDFDNNTGGGNVIGGYEGNDVQNNAIGATVSGGGASGTRNLGGSIGERVNTNEVTDDYGTVGGGYNNRATKEATVGGGSTNTASGRFSIVGGGETNIANGESSTIGGGRLHIASGAQSTIGGGLNNTTNGGYSTVGGGKANEANGDSSTIGGGRSNIADGAQPTIGGGSTNFATGDFSTIGGGQSNTAGAQAATVGGGGSNLANAREATVGGGGNNVASAPKATVGGGKQNTASAQEATVAGGKNNTADSVNSTIGGGSNNKANGGTSTVSGGTSNEAYGGNSTICGGENNRTGESGTQKASHATVAGGENNVAREDYSFAAGREAYARAEGSFVWGDSSDKFVESLTPDEVVFQASGGVVMWTTNNNSVGAKLPDGDSSWSAASARAVKSNIDPVDPSEVLAGVEDLEVSTWEYDTRRRVTHMGPMAGDFHDAFDLGDDPERISGVDADGVALAAIQGLSAKLDDRDERIADLEAELAEKADRIDALEAENKALGDETEALRAENETLRERLAAVEERLDTIEASSASLASADD